MSMPTEIKTEVKYIGAIEMGNVVSINKGGAYIKLKLYTGTLTISERDVEMFNGLFNKAKEGTDD